MSGKFRIITRKKPDGKVKFVARYLDAEGRVIRSETLEGVRTVSGASAKALERIKDGITGENPEALGYILAFWTEDSPYALKKARRKKPLSVGYLYNNRGVVSQHFAPVLKGRGILDLTPAMIEKQVAKLARDGVGPRTINRGLQAVQVPIRWYCRMNRLAFPLEYVEKETESPRERGVLTMAELGRIIASAGRIGGAPRPADQVHGPGPQDVGPNVYAGILLAALCGLRAGEVRGLQYDDVDTEAGIIRVCHNWVNDKEGIKAPKTRGSVREVPAPDAVLRAVELCQAMTRGPFVFYNVRRTDKPGGIATLRKGYVKVLRSIGIDDSEQERRNLVYHGLRHLFVSLSRNAGIPDFVVQRLAGHRTTVMMENYSHIVDFAAAKAAMSAMLKEAAGVN